MNVSSGPASVAVSTSRRVVVGIVVCLSILLAADLLWVALMTLGELRDRGSFHFSLFPVWWTFTTTCILGIGILGLLARAGFQGMAYVVFPVWLLVGPIKALVVAAGIPRPFVGVRTTVRDGFIVRDAVLAAQSPVALQLERAPIVRADTSTYIERRFFSWRYALVLGRSLDDAGSIEEARYEISGPRQVVFGLRAASENYLATLLLTGLPLALLVGIDLRRSRSPLLDPQPIVQLSTDTLGLCILGFLIITALFLALLRGW